MIRERLSRRRFLAAGAQGAVALGSAGWLHGEAVLPPGQSGTDKEGRSTRPSSSAKTDADRRLDAYIADYMAAMNAPGLTLGMTDRKSTLRAVSYGLSDIARQLPVKPSQLFQIGSITKSFVALVLLQMREEGKVDFHKPILDYLPLLPLHLPFGAITPHHLLTHTSGLPDNMDVVLSDPRARHVQGFKPGEHFHYCNLGFGILGQLIAKVDGRPWVTAVQARIFDKVGMTDTVGVIDTASRPRSAVGHIPYYDDLQYWRQGRLTDAGNLVMDDPAGSIASTPGDMAKYMRMLLNRGEVESGRVVSAESFDLFSKPQIAAEEFSPTASYAYGIAVDTLDGHRILRHTGGMVAFASSLHVDLDGGVAAFASINSMQGYRPTEVTEYAVRLLRAAGEAKPLPDAPILRDPRVVTNGQEYAGTYRSASGKQIVVRADKSQLLFVNGSRAVPLENAGADTFVAAWPTESEIDRALSKYSLVFGRARAHVHDPKEPGAAQSRVVELGIGPELYIREGEQVEAVELAPGLSPCVGEYRSPSPWTGTVRVFARNGRLFADSAELVRIGDGLFRMGAEDWSPDTAEFLCVNEGKAGLLKITGTDCWRVDLGSPSGDSPDETFAAHGLTRLQM